MYDITDEDSFQKESKTFTKKSEFSAKIRIEKKRDGRETYFRIQVQSWVRELKKMLGEEISLVIVGNKTDLESKRVISKFTSNFCSPRFFMPFCAFFMFFYTLVIVLTCYTSLIIN